MFCTWERLPACFDRKITDKMLSYACQLLYITVTVNFEYKSVRKLAPF